MTILKHELRSGRISLIIWSLAISFFLAVCILIYPQISVQMEGVSDLFSQMGGFSQAFGMDKINFGEFIGFFGVECGNILGLGGAFFAALLGISALSGEEAGHTAEFLFTHPVSRLHIAVEKLFSVFVQITLFQTTAALITALCIHFIGQTPPLKPLVLLFIAYYLLQIEIACICFCLSAFFRKKGMGAGLGIAVALYFLNLIANLTESAKFLKYFTPFGFADSSAIIANESLNAAFLIVGAVVSVLCIVLALHQFNRKDLAA